MKRFIEIYIKNTEEGYGFSSDSISTVIVFVDNISSIKIVNYKSAYTAGYSIFLKTVDGDRFRLVMSTKNSNCIWETYDEAKEYIDSLFRNDYTI